MEKNGHILKKIAADNKSGLPVGVFSVCTANPLVIRAAMRHSKKLGYPLVLESTSNQCNQFGGYTGMTPRDYVDMVKCLAVIEDYPMRRLILGGDHLGPIISRTKPESEAMKDAEDMVYAYTEAGFDKIHIDTSMRLGDDNPELPLRPEVCAERAARLAQTVQRAYHETVGLKEPVLIVGSEVPIPGGSMVHEDSVAPTDPVELLRQISAFRAAFERRHLSFDQVVGFVAQPGVEFGDDFVNIYDADKAAALVEQMRGQNLVLEGHSTDYQSRDALCQLVRDGVAILKVGPALTFALREALMLLEKAGKHLESHVEFASVLEKAMIEDDRYWRNYYSGNEKEVAYKRIFSYSDRCRYYLPVKDVDFAVQSLLRDCDHLPPAVLSLYFPRQYTKYLNGVLQNDVYSVVFDRVGDVLDDYAAACFLQTGSATLTRYGK